MTDTTSTIDPGPSTATQIGLGAGLVIGLVAGMVIGMLSIDWAGFQFGKTVENMRMNRLIDQASSEAVLYKTTGYHSIREMIQAYEEREDVALALRRFEAEFLKERAAELDRLTR